MKSASPRLRFLLVAFWAVPFIVAVIGFQIVPSARNSDIPFAQLVLSQFLTWFMWAVWSPIIIATSDRVPLERGNMLRALMTHVPVAIVVISVQLVFMAYVWEWFNLSPERHLSSKLAIGWRSYGDLFFVVYGAVVGAHAAMRWYSAWQEERILAAQLERDLKTAQLSALRSQLNPHFLFNSLHSVVTLIGRDPDGARRMVVRLADLLRATLGIANEQTVPLSRELEMVRNYLDVELVRFADRLSVAWDIDERALEAMVPAFALQPLVENAIVHGVSRVSGPCQLTITAGVTANRLRLSVADNGPGPQATPSARASSGIGLTNLRARLKTLFAEETTEVRLLDAPGGGALATVDIPLSFVVSVPATTSDPAVAA